MKGLDMLSRVDPKWPLPRLAPLRRAARLGGCLAAAATGAFAEGVVLKVFGGSSLDMLAPRQPPDVQKSIQDKVIRGFLAGHPEVSSVDWDAQGPQSGSLQPLMTAKRSGPEIDLVARPAAGRTV